MKFVRASFVLFGLIVAAPAMAQTPDDNAVINAYRNQGSGGTPTDNFMYNVYQQHGPGTPTDNFMQDILSPRHNNSGVYQDYQNNRDIMSPRHNSGVYEDDQDDQ